MRHSGNLAVSAALGALLLFFAGCSSAPVEVPSRVEAHIPPREATAATTFATIPAALPDTTPHAATDGIVLRVKQDLPVHFAPGGAQFAKLPPTQLNNPTWVPVVAQRGVWARVLLPSRPNNSTGWVRTDDPQAVQKARTPYLVDVDVNARRMTVSRYGREVGAWRVGVGAAETPTPRGRTFILASIEETVSRFSPVILPLGSHSETLNSYGGGPGTVALHGWPEPSVFGRASSDGCVRVPDEALQLLVTLPLGTLVLLR